MQQTILFDKDHSVKAAVADAWGLFARTWKRWLRASWVYLILAGGAQALLFELIVRYLSQHALPALRLSQAGGDPMIVKYLLAPDWLGALYLLLTFVLVIVTAYGCGGRLVRLVSYYKAYNVMPRLVRPQLAREDRRAGLRLLIIDALTLAVTAVITALFALLAFKVSVWTLVPYPLVMIYVCSTRQVARVHYALNRLKLGTALRRALRHSLGTPLVVQILTWIPAALLSLVFVLPALVYLFGSLAAADSLLRDDATTVPVWLPLLFFLINALCLAAQQLISAWRFWALGMKCRA